MNVDFKEIKDYFYNNRYSNNIASKYAGMFEKVSQVIDEDDILYFYPKYLFVDEQTLQLYFILKNNKFIKVWINGDKHIVIEYFNINRIKSVTYECPLDDYGDYRLTLLFEENVEEITFISKEDTNEGWKYKFDEAICSIAKYFCTNK
ncbi:DUF3908 family protein [Tepidanaerobacter sp. GT38]|uniref:DUF3908 family protein n=1 Tax=Tepidanaerobacter sp. GT38 TaxID=2722793 RepID=UPI001F2BE7D7|nr:DUF3908 family protein [Tepidanaerobacter sp. GT38]MCG1012153.1 DUF3908 family protein [Tepidanaerobacter sp. GT38]